MSETKRKQQTNTGDAAHNAAHADTIVDAHAAMLFNARYEYVAVLADPGASAGAIENARKAHAGARDAYDAAYFAAFNAARAAASNGRAGAVTPTS
jgi:hypothetical protein